VVWTEGIKSELAKRLPKQRKTQRDKLALLVATMLHVRSANLVELAAGLPRESDRWDMGYQWISRFLANDLVCCDTVMEPFAREILARLAETGPSTSAQEPIPLILDQTTASDRHQILMLSVRWGERALPLAPACAGAGSGGSKRPKAPLASPRKKSCSRSSPAGCLLIWGWFCSLTASTEPPR
jgi:hypothetical protein